MLITPGYVRANAALHDKHASYGAFGARWADRVRALLARTGGASVLDYGCGKGTLGRALEGVDVRDYDPGVPGKDALPEPADVVVCTDVLEHIEPDCVDDVIAHLGGLTRRAAFLNVSTRRAAKTLADGRNAHLIVEPSEWWRERIGRRFRIEAWEVEVDQVNAVAVPLSPRPGEGAGDTA